MALWQYAFHILPKESTKNLTGFKFTNDEEGFDDSPFWIDQQVKNAFFEDIGNILPKEKSWSNNINLYGNQESNCFEVLVENGIVVSVSLRIDFTGDYETILNELIEFFILKGLVILDESLNVLPLNFEIIKAVIDSSPQVERYKALSNH